MHCPACRSTIPHDVRFCPECGRLLADDLLEHAAKQAAGLDGVFDLGEITRLRDVKARLDRELRRVLGEAAVRELDVRERSAWHDLYGRWREVSRQLTAQMDSLSARDARQRREQERRGSQRRSQRSGVTPSERRVRERRAGERRSGEDRRDPFADKTPRDEDRT